MIPSTRSDRNRRVRNAARFTVAATAGVAGMLTASAVAHADPNSPYNWINSNGGNFSDPTSWSNGLSPAGDFATTLNFGASGTYTVVDDVPAGGGQFDVNQVNFNSSPGNTVTIGVGSALTALTFGGNGASVSLNGGGSANIATPVYFNGPSTQITNYGIGTLTLNSLNFSNGSTASIVNAGTGTVTLSDGVADYGTNVTLNLNNSGGGLFQIGNIATVTGIPTAGINGTLNIVAGPVTFAGNTSGDLFTNILVLNVSSGASFNFANNGETMGGISGAGNIIMGTANLTLVEPGNREYDGSISGTGGVTQDVSAVLTLGGQNLYSGTTTIEAGGTIQAAAANVLSPNSLLNIVAGAGTLNTAGYSQTVAGFEGDGGGVLTLTGGTFTSAPVAGSTATFYGSLAGAGNFAVTGPGVQWIDGTNTLTGTTTVTGGTLHESYAGLAASSGITVGPAGTLDIYVTGNVTDSLVMNNTGGLTKSGSGTLTFNASSQNQNLAALTVAAGTLVIDHTNDNATSLGTPALAVGSGFLQVLGNASAANSTAFAGVSLIGGGEIDVTAAGTKTETVSLGSITRLAGSGGTINFNPTNAGGSITTSSVNLTGANTLGGYATYNGSSWAVAGTGGVITSLAAYTTGAAGFSTSTLLHADVIANTSVGSNTSAYDVRFNTATTTTLTLSGINTLADGGILKTPNSSTYASTITGGTSLTAAANQDVIVNQFDTAAALTIASVISNTPGTPVNETVASLGTSTTITGLTTAGLYVGELVTGGTFGATSNAHIVAILSPTSVLVTDALAQTAGTNVTLTFQPETNLVKAGPGTLVMSGKNTFTGVTYLDGGTINASSTVLSLGSNSSSGSSALVFDGGTLYAGSSQTTGSAIQPWIVEPGGATVTIASGYTVSKYGNSVFGSGPITVNSPGAGAGIFSVGSDSSSFSGPVTINSGIFRFTSNQFASADGVTIGNGAQYQIEDNATASWNFALGTPLILNGSGPTGYTYPGAFALTVQSGTTGVTSTFENPVVLATPSTFGIYSTAVYPAQLVLSGVVSGPGTLNVVGISTSNNTGGTLVLSSPNTYTGGSVVGNGTAIGQLAATNTTGSATGTGAVNVSSSGTLFGTGIISGVVTVNPGGTIFAGLVNNPAGGNKSAAVLTIGSGSSLQGSTLLDLTAAPVAPATLGASDEIVFGSIATPGTAVLGGSLTVTNPNSIAFAIGETFDLLGFGSNPGSTDFQSITLPALPTGLAWNDNSLPVNGSISVVSSVQNLTFNNSGGTGDGMTWNSSQQNFYNGSGPSTFNPGDNVTFDDTTLNNQYLVVIPGQVAPGSVTVNNSAGNYVFNGSGGITGSTGLTKLGTGTLTINTANTYTGETDVDGGTLVLGPKGTIAGNLVVNSGGTFNASANTPGAGILVRSMGVLTINGGGVAAIAPTAAHSDRTVLVVAGLNVVNVAGATGTLDLSNNDMDVTNASTSTLSTVTQLVASGFNLAGGGNWNGSGITSSTAGANSTHLTALGVIANSVNGVPIFGSTTASGLFDGLSPAPTDVLVKYTYVGDANLDGKVDGSDYSLIDAGFASNGALTGWYYGDFNYDGVIDGSDYALIDNAFNNQGSPLTTPSALVATETDQVAGAPTAAVPEPASMGLIAAAAIGLAARRRRR